MPTNAQPLKTHPDRVAADSPERASRTRKFQLVNDAYYTLCDPTRRRDYDSARTYHGFGASNPEDTDDVPDPAEEAPKEGGGFSFPWSTFGFSSKAKTEEEKSEFENKQLGDVFEEMLREEGMAEGQDATPTSKFWSVVGGLSGGAMGFIVANFPGMLAGAVAGNRMGAVRDAKGKSVYTVFQVSCGLSDHVSETLMDFQELPQGDKARLMSQLAAKVFSHAIGS